MPTPITEHEQQIICRLVELGHTDQDIADTLDCDPATVARYRRAAGTYRRRRVREQEPARRVSLYE